MHLLFAIFIIFIIILAISSTIFSISISEKKFTKLVVFGDSYSDNGNVYELTSHAWPPPIFFEGRFTNGKVWAEYLGEELGIELECKAHSSATIDNDLNQGCSGLNFDIPVPGIKQQVDQYILENKGSKEINHTIYAILTVGNDYTFPKVPADPIKVVEILGLLLERLVTEMGASHVFIPDLLDTTTLPHYKGSKPETLTSLKAIINSHNAALDTLLKSFVKKHPIHIYRLPTPEVFTLLISKESQETLKITNILDVCTDFYSDLTNLNLTSTICKNPDDFFYWDAFHPTTKVHLAFARVCAGIIKKDQ